MFGAGRRSRRLKKPGRGDLIRMAVLKPNTGNKARAYFTMAPGAGAIREIDLPGRSDDDVLVEAQFSGISRGTETLVFRGEVPETEADRMRCPFQEGGFPGPVKYGYALVGRIVEGPQDRVGEPVFVLHPHQDRAVVPATWARPIPKTVPAKRAVLAANMETALNAIWDGGVGPADRVSVVGAGVVGLLIGYLAARCPGTDVEMIDVDPAKRSVTETLGMYFVSPKDAAGGRDIVYHATGHNGGLETALGLAGTEATVVEVSWYGDRPVTVSLGHGFHPDRLTLISSQVGSVSPSRRPRWTHARRLDAALTLLEDDRLDSLIDGESDLADLPDVMSALAEGRLSTLCHRIRYP